MLLHVVKNKMYEMYPYLENSLVDVRLSSVCDSSYARGAGWLVVTLDLYYNYRRRSFASFTCFFNFDGFRTEGCFLRCYNSRVMSSFSGVDCRHV